MGDLGDEQDTSLHVLRAAGPVLDASSVALLAEQLDALGPGKKALDLSALTRETPQGWSSLIELLSRQHGGGLSLCGLSRSFLLSAIDLSLGELCAIYTDVPALELAQREGGP